MWLLTSWQVEWVVPICWHENQLDRQYTQIHVINLSDPLSYYYDNTCYCHLNLWIIDIYEHLGKIDVIQNIIDLSLFLFLANTFFHLPPYHLMEGISTSTCGANDALRNTS